MFLRSRNQMHWSRILSNPSCGSHLGFFQNGDCFFLKNTFFQLLSIIYTWFWYLNICFQRQGIKFDDLKYRPMLILAAILDFPNGGLFSFLKTCYILASKYRIHMILVSKYMFSRSRNWMQWLKSVLNTSINTNTVNQGENVLFLKTC